MDIPPDRLEICLDVLQQISEDPATIADHGRLKALIAKIHREGKKGARRNAREKTRAEDRERVQKTAIVQAQREQMVTGEGIAGDLPGRIGLHRPRPCYACKQPFTQLHPFYHQLCPICAESHYARRCQRADLTGRTALVTGGRIKVGYQIALRLLRDGARVIATTRFPRAAALRFGGEADAREWLDRLQIYGLDLRILPTVEAFADHLLHAEPALDILINNAAQTIKRAPEFYAPQLALERQPVESLPPPVRAVLKGSATALPEGTAMRQGHWANLPGHLSDHLPEGALDPEGQPPDLRASNSWSLRLHEVGSVEALEALLVNAVSPLVLNARLKPLLLRSSFSRRFIINVSAMEGQFNRKNKTFYHPHTNMAKAALNMMTRTAASDYARDGIYMNSVDTGWITDENPHLKKTRMQEEYGFYTPLDVIDGAARVYDPIARGLNEPEEPIFGCFLKDYAPHPW